MPRQHVPYIKWTPELISKLFELKEKHKDKRRFRIYLMRDMGMNYAQIHGGLHRYGKNKGKDNL
jgi:hypothetical protein